MPTTDKELLYQIARDVGQTKEGIENIKDQVADTVHKDECTQRHVVVAHSINALKTELVAEFKKVPTGQAHHAISAEMIEAHEQERRERRRRNVLFWITMLTGIGAIGSGVVLGAWKVFGFMDEIQQGITETKRELRTEIKATKTGSPRVIYIKVPMPPDAGTRRPVVRPRTKR